MWHSRKDRHIGQCNTLENPEIDQHIYGQYDFYTVVERVVFSMNGDGTTGHLMAENKPWTIYEN